MDDVARISVAQFEAGDFPRIDVLDASTAEKFHRFDARIDPGSASLLLLLGIVPYFVWRSRQERPVTGQLPLSADTASKVAGRRRVRRSIALVGVAALATSISLFAAGSENSRSGLIVLVASFVLAFLSARTSDLIAVTLEPAGPTVTFHAHHGFTEASERHLAAHQEVAERPTLSATEQLERLARLHGDGKLTDDEFSAAKAKTLS